MTIPAALPLFTAAVFASLAACSSSADVTGPMTGQEVKPSFETVTDNENIRDFPWTYESPNPCRLSEIVTLTGTVHLVMKTTFSSGGTATVEDHAIGQGTGQGFDAIELTLRNYSGRLEQTDTFQGVPAGGSILDVLTFLVNGPAKEDDFFLHMVIKVTLSLTGFPVPTVENIVVKCGNEAATVSHL